MLNIYKLLSEHISNAVAVNGEQDGHVLSTCSELKGGPEVRERIINSMFLRR